jgi:hypothetical protein
MFSLLATLLYLAAVLVPIHLLRRYGAVSWYWHALAIAGAVGVGMAPGTTLLNSVAGTYLYGFAFVFLGVWGAGGLLFRRTRRSRHVPVSAG